MNKYELYLLVNSHWRGPAAIERRLRVRLDCGSGLSDELHFFTAHIRYLRDMQPQPTFTSFFWYLVWQLTGYANPDSLIKRE
jgi:hypothetical protein